MLLKAQALPADLLKGWEAEIVETTTLDGSVVKYAPTGYVEDYHVTVDGELQPTDHPARTQRDRDLRGKDSTQDDPTPL